jgi:hypothetical protein
MNLGLHFDWLETHHDKRYVQTWGCVRMTDVFMFYIKMSPKLKIKNDDINKQQKQTAQLQLLQQNRYLESTRRSSCQHQSLLSIYQLELVFN